MQITQSQTDSEIPGNEVCVLLDMNNNKYFLLLQESICTLRRLPLESLVKARN